MLRGQVGADFFFNVQIAYYFSLFLCKSDLTTKCFLEVEKTLKIEGSAEFQK
jgi:hypothetical protein